jgi:transcription elongation factor Elf1
MLEVMSERTACPECGSGRLVDCSVYEHGTWIHRLTCWTCGDCQTVVAVDEAPVPSLPETT